MLIHGLIVESLVVNGVFMLCGNIILIEPIDYRCVTSSSTIRPCTTSMDACGALVCCLMDVFKVRSSTYCKAMLGDMQNIQGTKLDEKKLFMTNLMNKIDTSKWLFI
jgi:hypothetical protein